MSRTAPLLALLVALASLTTGIVGASDLHAVGHAGAIVAPQSGELGIPASVEPTDPAAAADDGVRVGVIGSRFDATHPALDGRVAAHTQLSGPALTVVSPSGATHDTAVAEIVADRTDDASLYLVGVGDRPTPRRYEHAVSWLLANDVDVIVDSGSYFPSTAGGMKRISAAAERATDAGAVVVTSAGNYARRHWRGTPETGGWVEFGDGVQGNRLGDGAVSGRVTLRLYWDGDADYDLYLYRDLPGSNDPVVAESTRGEGNAEAIDARLPRGHYYVAVYAREVGAEPVDLFAAEHALAFADANGSAVAPANAEGVISVGAVDATGAVRPYSSGTGDVAALGTVDTSVTGRFEGTSAAAPLVAGAVASMHENASLSPAEVEAILRGTDDDDARTIDVHAALAAAANATDAPTEGSWATAGEARTNETAAAPGP